MPKKKGQSTASKEPAAASAPAAKAPAPAAKAPAAKAPAAKGAEKPASKTEPKAAKDAPKAAAPPKKADSHGPATKADIVRVPTAAEATLFTRDTEALVYNFKPIPVQGMLDFDHLCRRKKPSIAGLIAPGAERGNHKVFFGAKEILIPIYGSVADAVAAHPNADVFINYASFRSAFDSSVEALNQESIRTVVIIAEGVPESSARKLLVMAKRTGKTVIGPATVGGIQAGAFKIGDTAGLVDNIIACKLYRPGSVGFVSKSGGLSNECYNILSRTTDGLYEGIATLFLDLMESCAAFSSEEINEIVELGYLNGLFVLARTIGLVGHALDQKRLKQPLYRHPWDDVMYL